MPQSHPEPQRPWTKSQYEYQPASQVQGSRIQRNDHLKPAPFFARPVCFNSQRFYTSGKHCWRCWKCWEISGGPSISKKIKMLCLWQQQAHTASTLLDGPSKLTLPLIAYLSSETTSGMACNTYSTNQARLQELAPSRTSFHASQHVMRSHHFQKCKLVMDTFGGPKNPPFLG